MLKYMKKYWILGLVSALFMVGEVSLDLIQPKLMSTIVDEGVLGINTGGVGNMQLIITTGIQMIGLLIIGGTCGIMCGVFENLCSQNYANDIRKDAFKKIMHLSFQQTEQFSTGSLITRVTNDITQIQQLVRECVRGIVRTFMLFAGGIFCMLALDLSFGVVIACALPVVFFFVFWFIHKANPRFMILQKKLDKVNNVMQENVSGTRVVKSYVKEEYEIKRFGKANQELVDTQLDVLLLLSYMTPLMNIVMNVAVVFVIYVGGIEVQSGFISPGIVMAAITYITQILNAVLRMAMIFQSISRGMASSRRVKEILICEPVIKDGNPMENKEVMDYPSGSIEFRNVSFAYPKTEDRMILNNINLKIAPGETVGILGATGCGKSSLVNLIPRFYDVVKGKVLVDGVDVREYSLQELRKKVAIALQKSEIFSTTIRENILWGDIQATEEEVQLAADIAQATEFIDNKEEKMHTLISQGGMSLSGGQRQRLAISRTILKKAPILIFDDATSALDLKTEAQLYQALNTRYGNQTKIIVAQRIASLKNANRIVVLDKGKIAACGSHEQLMKTSVIYQDIYDSQMNGGEPNGRAQAIS